MKTESKISLHIIPRMIAKNMFGFKTCSWIERLYDGEFFLFEFAGTVLHCSMFTSTAADDVSILVPFHFDEATSHGI